MSITTKIQWCDSTCNPTMGCDGCELWSDGDRTCYAGRLHVRFGGSTKGYAPSFEEVTSFAGRMALAARWPCLAGRPRSDKPWLDGLPRRIFVSDMSDALSAAVPFDFLLTEVIETAGSAEGQRHDWLWLTKRPHRMASFCRWLRERNITWPENLWAGTSITTQATASRVRHLLAVGDERTRRFLSVEPQRGPIDLAPWLNEVDWVIQGGESGRGAAPFDLAWARGLRDACQQAGRPYFLKQLGSRVVDGGTELRFADGHAGDWHEWPEDVRVREASIETGGDVTEQPAGGGHPEQVRRGAGEPSVVRARTP